MQRSISDTAQFQITVATVLNGLIVSSFVLFGRNSSALRFSGEPEAEVESEDRAQPEVAEVEASEVVPTEPVVQFEPEPVIEPAPEEAPQVVIPEPLPEEGTEKDDADSEKDAIFEATLFEKNAELLIGKAKLEADKILFAAEQELQKIRQEKEKVENELKLLVRTEKQLLEQYRDR